MRGHYRWSKDKSMSDSATHEGGGSAGPAIEVSRRKPGWSDAGDGVMVPLANGEDWLFPRPYTLYEPDANEDGDITEVWSLGPEYKAKVDAIAAAATVRDLAKAEFDAVRFLLGVNYDLEPGDLPHLVRLTYSDNAPEDLKETNAIIRQVFMGQFSPKKHSAGGSA